MGAATDRKVQAKKKRPSGPLMDQKDVIVLTNFLLLVPHELDPIVQPIAFYTGGYL